MIRLHLSELLDAVGGTLMGNDCEVAAVSTDTRQAMPEALFIALNGANFDAHNFVDDAEEQGAAALLVERKVDSTLPQVLVDDTRIAMGQLAAYLRKRLNVPCCGITGSNGKTSVKEMVTAILSQRAKVLSTNGNFNNDIGVPLTLLRFEEQHQLGVIEMGANHRGEIAYTASLVEPKVALINNVSAAHIEGFGSQQGVVIAKSELFQQLDASGLAICELHSSYRPDLEAAAGEASLQYFDFSDTAADYYASDFEDLGVAGSRFVIHSPYGQVAVSLALAGEHNVKNALAASAMALAMGASLEDVPAGLASLQAVPGRLAKSQLSEQVTLVDDSYNANPASFNAAMQLLAGFDGDKFLIAGQMGEMGEQSEQAHEDLVTQALDSGLRLYCYGRSFCAPLRKHDRENALYSTHQDLFDQLFADLKNSSAPCMVLVKGSRSSQMEQIVARLQQQYKEGFPC